MKAIFKKRTKLHTAIYIICVVLVFIGGAYFLLSPNYIASVNSDLEDIKKYITEEKIKQEKLEFQKTLAPGEEVVELYNKEPKYFQVTNTCDWQFLGKDCVLARIGPGTSYPEAYLHYERLGIFPVRIRQGQTFPVTALIKASDESLWYKVGINTAKVTFPERLKTDWYVPAAHFTLVDNTPINPLQDSIKRIVIILSTQKLFAYEGKTLFMETKISTGTANIGLETDTGNFHIFKKNPMTIMEGPLPTMVSMITEKNLANFEYTLFVPYAMAFAMTPEGIAFIHGAYWHNGFGSERSHGCVNLIYEDALKLYNWTPDPLVKRIPVTVLP